MADSQYTIFQPRQAAQPVAEQGFFEKYPSPLIFAGKKLGFIPEEEPAPTQVKPSTYTVFQPRAATPPPAPEPNVYEKYVAPVASFGVQTLSSGLGQLAQGATGLVSLSRNFPRRVVDTFTKSSIPQFSKDGTIQKQEGAAEKIGWIKTALDDYEQAFDSIKSGMMPTFKGNEEGKATIGQNLATMAGAVAAEVPAFTNLIAKSQQSLSKEFEPGFLKDPTFVSTYEAMPLREKILKYPAETLRLVAPGVLGSGLAIAGTTFITGGTGAGSLILSAATGEDVKNAAINNGVNPQQAETLGAATAVPVMFLEKFGFDTILGKGALKNIGTSFGGRILKSMTAEAGTELSQEAVQIAMEKSFREVTGDEVKTRLAMSALGGALGGLAFGTTAAAFNTIAGRAEAKEGQRATSLLESTIQKSPKADIIEVGLDYQPTPNAVLKQSFVDSMVKDVSQQVDLIADEGQREETLKALQRLPNKEYKNLREFQVNLARLLPKDLDIRAMDTIVGQEFNKAIATSDKDSQQYMAEFAFENKEGDKRSPLNVEEITLAESPLVGGEAAPPQNIVGDVVNRLKEASDELKKENTSDPKVAADLLNTRKMIAKLQKESKTEETTQSTTAVFQPKPTEAQLNIETTPVTRPLAPVQSGGEQQTSRLASNVEAGAIEEKLTESFGALPTYARANMKEQSELATQLLQTDPVRAKRIALGDEAAPDNLLPESVFTAVEEQAKLNEDVDTLRELAVGSTLSLEATAMGQRIRALGERESYSPTTIMSNIANLREVQAEKQDAKLPKQKQAVAQEIEQEIAKTASKPKDWQSFIDSLQC